MSLADSERFEGTPSIMHVNACPCDSPDVRKRSLFIINHLMMVFILSYNTDKFSDLKGHSEMSGGTEIISSTAEEKNTRSL
jgi:hypothetical protein